MRAPSPIHGTIVHHRQADDAFRIAIDVDDPIFAVLDAANTAETAHGLACDDLDERDDAAMRGCNAACDRAAEARREVMRTLPMTVGGLRALACHYVRWDETFAEDGFLHIARTLEGCDPSVALRARRREA